jgi:phospholipid/cholesterol/gamma-HCH transport system ATP-binding protein
VRFDGNEVTAMSEAELSKLRQRIAMLFQAGALFDSMTVGENVAYGLEEHFRETMSVKDRADRVQWALELVGLPGIQDMDPADLSGGMRKRVALARSIAVQPEVVLYDEPTTGLDPINTARVNHLITGLQRRLSITSIVVTHDMKSAFTVSDRIAMVHGGRIIYQGSTRDFRSASDPRIADFIEGRAPVNEDVETLLKA